MIKLLSFLNVMGINNFHVIFTNILKNFHHFSKTKKNILTKEYSIEDILQKH